MKELIEEWIAEKNLFRKMLPALLKRFKTKKKVDENAEIVHQEVFEKIDCLSCANCCKTIPPIVNNTDAKRIAKYLGQSLKKFEKTYLKIDGDGDQVMNSSPCPFLEEDNACFVYDVRPKACRKYPHTDEGQFSSEGELHLSNVDTCPAVFHILKRMKSLYA